MVTSAECHGHACATCHVRSGSPRSVVSARRVGPQGLRQNSPRRPAIGRELGQCAEHRVFHSGRNRVAHRRDRRRAFGEHLGDDRLHARAGERRIAGEHLVRHHAERVDVGARVDRPFAHRLFRAHVLRRAEGEAGLRHPLAAGALHGERDAEIGDQGMAALQQDVLRLDVAMDHATGVGVAERVGDFAGDEQGIVDRQLPFARQPGAQRLADRQTA